MRFEKSFLEEVKDRTRLSEVIGRRVKLVRNGRDFKGLCPFHNEKTPSFVVHDDKGYYKCFGCAATGDVYTFVCETENLDFNEAVEKLAEAAGIAVPQPTPQARAEHDQRQRLFLAMEAAAAFCEMELRGPRGQAARDYLRGRGLTGDAITRFRLGYAPGRDAMKAHLVGRGFTERELIACGLLKEGEYPKAPFDFFRDRVMFPITDLRGRVIAFGARTLQPDGQPKYLNSPATPLFDKSATLYNAATARAAAREARSVIVAEGYMDVIALVLAGFPHAVAPLGTAFTEKHLRELWKYADEPVFCFDGDKAGLTAAYRAVDVVLPAIQTGVSARFALLPEGQDPDDLIGRRGAEAMRDVLTAAKPLSDMLWQRETQGADIATPDARARLEAALERAVAAIGDAKLKAHYTQEYRARLRVLFGQAYGYGPPGQGRGPGMDTRTPPGGRRGRGRFEPPPVPVSPQVMASPLGQDVRGGERSLRPAEALLLLGLVRHPFLIPEMSERLAGLALVSPYLDKARDALIDHAAQDVSLDGDALENHLTRVGFGSLPAVLEGCVRPEAHPWLRKDAGEDAVRSGWEGALRRVRKELTAQEIEAASDELQRNPSPEAEAYLMELLRRAAEDPVH